MATEWYSRTLDIGSVSTVVVSAIGS